MDITAKLAPATRKKWRQAAQRRLLLAALLISDTVTVGLALTLAFWTGRFSRTFLSSQVDPTASLTWKLVGLLLVLWLAMMGLYRLYDPHYLLGGTQEYALVFSACTTAAVVVVGLSFLVGPIVIARGWLILAWAFSILLTGLARFTLRRVVYALRRRGHFLNVNLRLSSDLFEIMPAGRRVKDLRYVPLIGVNRVRLEGADVFLKWALDLGLTVPGLILISPLLLILGVVIRLDSPGPIIYRRRVMGLGGREFDAYKFRTMAVDGEAILEAHPELRAELEQNHKLKNDPRVTRVGCFLRKYSLDELPQLVNVLRGQMSLVGPRMISPTEMAEYGAWGANLLTVRPGLTGLWQVSGRADVPYDERVRMDMHYIRNWTIWLDLQILFQTIPAVLRGRGAY